MGDVVSGSDEKLAGHNPSIVENVDLVVYSDAIKKDNVELARANELGIECVSRGEFLGRLCAKFDTVFTVCGCHGKTTTTAMLYSVLYPFSPTLHIGGKINDFAQNGAHVCSEKVKTTSSIMISEACEYQRNFLYLNPDYCIFTNVDYDHPDCYKNLGDVKKAYKDFYKNCQVAFVNADDKHSAFLLSLDRSISFGTSVNADFRACNVKPTLYGYTFDVFYHQTYLGEFCVSVKGMHNVYNALSVIACATTFGLGRTQILRGLQSFSGVMRRNEQVGLLKNVPIYSDYAHHPSEILSEIDCLKSMYKRILVVFQPHTYSRTNNLLSGFVRALSKADKVIIVPTFASREVGSENRVLYKNLTSVCECEYCENADILSRVKDLATAFDCVCFMGAGDIDDYARALVCN